MYSSPSWFFGSMMNTKVTFQALVDAIIPFTPEIAIQLGQNQAAGGLNEHIDEYIIWSLDHYIDYHILPDTINFPLSVITASMLNLAAHQFVVEVGNTVPLNLSLPYGGIFAALSREDRVRVISLLEQPGLDLSYLPFPYRNNPTLLQSIIENLNRMIVFGYYSEWSGYGTTRLASPNDRKLECFPLSWKQIRYPGRSIGYRDFRGYLVEKFTE